MRLAAVLSLAAAVVAIATPAAAAPVVFSGSLGAGMVGTTPVSIASAELDLEADGLSVGLGLELRFDGGELLPGDWDEARDAARLLRHVLFARSLGSRASLSLAVGRLAGVTAGSGASVDGITAGVDLDQRRLGADVRLATPTSNAHMWIDDLIAPEIAAMRVAGAGIGPVDIGATAAGDRALGRSSLGIEASASTSRGSFAASFYADAVRILEVASGLHVGGRGRVELAKTQLGLRLEAHAGTRDYVAGWIGPLHYRDRQIEPSASTARQVGGLVELDIASARIGSLRARVERRAGRGPGARLEMRLTQLRAIQAGAWAAVTNDAAAFGSEVRIRFPRSLFSRLEARRQYSTAAAMSPLPVWAIAATFGATVGE